MIIIIIIIPIRFIHSSRIYLSYYPSNYFYYYNYTFFLLYSRQEVFLQLEYYDWHSSGVVAVALPTMDRQLIIP